MKISAVITVHNREKLVGSAISSALQQSFEPHEIIVVDDGSTDGTLSAIDRFRASVAVIQQENRGVASARNEGVSRATGEWVAFLDSDDVWDPGHLDRIRQAIEETDGRAGLYFSDTRLPADVGECSLWGESGFRVHGPHELASSGSEWAAMARQPMMIQSSVVDVRVFEDLGRFRTDLVVREDTHLFLKLCLGRPVCAVLGTGARMGGAGGSERLTSRFGTDSVVYREATRALYTDLLNGVYPLEASERREFETRLAGAHLWLARASIRHAGLGGLAPATSHIIRALANRPSRVLQALRRRLRARG